MNELEEYLRSHSSAPSAFSTPSSAPQASTSSSSKTRFPDLVIKVEGDYACFTRPEFKVERISYPVITPSAARGIFESIFYKPEFQYHITQIIPLNRPDFTSMTVNERLKGEKNADQRTMMMLRNPKFILKAQIIPRDYPGKRPSTGDEEAKQRDRFQRKLASGAYYHSPWLGMRDFEAFVTPPQDTDLPLTDWNEDLGLMFYDWDYGSPGKQLNAHFFHAEIKNGILHVSAPFNIPGDKPSK